MAMQHLVALSASVSGAMIAAGSPYGCGFQALGTWTCGMGALTVNITSDFDPNITGSYLCSNAAPRTLNAPENLADPSCLREQPTTMISIRLSTRITSMSDSIRGSSTTLRI